MLKRLRGELPTEADDKIVGPEEKKIILKKKMKELEKKQIKIEKKISKITKKITAEENMIRLNYNLRDANALSMVSTQWSKYNQKLEKLDQESFNLCVEKILAQAEILGNDAPSEIRESAEALKQLLRCYDMKAIKNLLRKNQEE